jgi:hypothetical protein
MLQTTQAGKDIMTKAKEKQKLGDILSAKSRWIKHSLARDSDGNSVSYLDPEACKFCLAGAIHLLCSEPCEGSAIEGRRTVDYDKLISMGHKLAGIIAKKYKIGKKPEYADFLTITNFNDDKKTTFKMIQEVIKELDK